MRYTRIFFILTTAFLLVFSSLASAEQQQSPAEENLPDEVLKKIDKAIVKVKPSLVRIFVVASRYENGREVKYETVGSGVIISREGHVVTNHHVAGNAKQIICTLSNREEIAADLIGTDPLADIAVIKMRGGGKTEFPAAGFGDSSRLRVGDRVLAMGSPFALSQSVTMGIVSNTEIVFPEFLPASTHVVLEGEDVGTIVRWIGHDAQIFGGNSGGPLVNLRGEIVGINEINIGIGGAIPGNQARDVAEKIISSGKVDRSWFGFEIQPLLGHDSQQKGALISGVIRGSPADEAGFLPGDILVSVAGRDVSIHFAEEVPILNQMLMNIPIGEKVEAKILRDGKIVVLHAVSREREYVMPRNVELSQWGMTARDLTFMDSKEMKREGQMGVIVTTVRPGGSCRESEPKINPGDVITGINGSAIENVAGFLKLTRALTEGKDGPVPVLVAFDRDKEKYLTVVKLRRNESEEQGINARKPWLPISTQVVTKDIASGMGCPGVRGMRITRVYAGSSAEKEGLSPGDVITAINEEALTPSTAEDGDLLDEMLKQYSIGSEVELKILRGKNSLKVRALLEPTPRSPKELKKYTDKNFEFTVRDTSFLDDVRENCEKEGGGVLVDSISEGGWASLARLSIGDLVISVNDRPIFDVSSFEGEMSRAAAKKQRSVVLKVLRGIHTLFIEMEPTWPDTACPD